MIQHEFLYADGISARDLAGALAWVASSGDMSLTLYRERDVFVLSIEDDYESEIYHEITSLGFRHFAVYRQRPTLATVSAMSLTFLPI